MRKDEFTIVDKLIEDSINEVLDKLRAKIEAEKIGYPPNADEYKTINKVVKIVDNYREEQ